MDIWTCENARSDTNTGRENSNTARNLQAQHKGINSAWDKCFKLTSACMLLLCVLLLTATMALWSQVIKQLTTEYNELQTRYYSLTIERDQLQTSYNNLTIERDQLQTSYNNLTTERDQLQKQKYTLQKRLTSVGWIFFKSTIYYISTEKKTWAESRQDCINRGADLAIINSKDEQDFVASKSQQVGLYIGLTDSAEEGVYKWVDGTPLTSAYWNSGNVFSDTDDCAVDGYGGNLGWFDRPCTENYSWICE